jgi:hypothetical protein
MACKFLLHKAFNLDRLAYKDCILQETDQMLRGDRCYKSLLRLGRSVNAPLEPKNPNGHTFTTTGNRVLTGVSPARDA